MSRKLLTLSLFAMFTGGQVFADTPRVSVDIAPVHSLVARVMEGVGMPDLIIQSGASPHEYSLRPSEAAALQDADLVFWIGPDLTPWLSKTIDTLAPNAFVTELLETEGTIELEFRDNAIFDAHDEEEQDHGHEEEHEHGLHDPHAWLSPKNAMTWLNMIASQLAMADPDNADVYFANASTGREEMENLISNVDTILNPVRGRQFVVFHDAYQYFETDFDFYASGAVSLSDASDPSPARVAEIQAYIVEKRIDCVLAEPQFNPNLVMTILDGTDAKMGILDPLGSDLKLGPAFYPLFIENLALAIVDCL